MAGAKVFGWGVCFCLAVLSVSAFNNKEFKKCADLSFCRRNRALTDAPGQFIVNKDSVQVSERQVRAGLSNGEAEFSVVVEMMTVPAGALHIKIDEATSETPRYETPFVIEEKGFQAGDLSVEQSADHMKVTGNGNSIIIRYTPFSGEVYQGDQLMMVLNERNLLNFDHYRAKTDDAEDGLFEETFKGHTDSKPKGPASVGLDFTFIGAGHVYGIPEHATDMALKPTRCESCYDEPYRLYNLDVFEYELDSPFGLYGAIPFMMGHSKEGTSAVFLLNTSEMYVDVNSPALHPATGKLSTQTHWYAESGLLDVFVFVAPSPAAIVEQYTTLTGKPYLPARFSLAYNQCRWNYKDEADVSSVDATFDEHDIPYDVLWLDIEHTDGKKYFTWDSNLFPTPARMQQELAAKSRKMVTIVDPHIKRASGYHLHDKATAESLYVKTTDGKDFDGHCWPGSSSYMDFLKQESRDAYGDEYVRYEGATETLHTWNDMNEPSVFNGPEMTMQKDLLHDNGSVEHRDVHNVYGMLHHMSSHGGLTKRLAGKRPFILTRSFFSGSQRYAGVWTGDNMANWDHLKAAQPMLLTLGLSGMPHVGSDVGGFFGNPDVELLVRWYQTGAYHPFFRAHAHIDTKRREPWLFGEPHTTHIRDAIRARYRLLPYWYTVARNSNITGVPMMRPLFFEFPGDEHTFSLQDQFLIGSDVMVVPVTEAGVTSSEAYLPGPQSWYDLDDGTPYQSPAKVTAPAPIHKTPVFQRGGSIIPMRWRARRSSGVMDKDPITLVVALDPEMKASGSLYLDDGESYGFLSGESTASELNFQDKTLTNTITHHAFPAAAEIFVERVVIRGVKEEPTRVVKQESGLQDSLSFTYNAEKGEVVIRKPVVSVAKKWSLVVE